MTVTPATNDLLAWILNFVLIYVLMYKRKYTWIASLFIGINCYLASVIIDSAVTIPVILIGALITIYFSLAELKKINHNNSE